MVIACIGAGPAGLYSSILLKLQSLPRYARLHEDQIFALLLERRSRVLPHLPPALYLKLKGARRELVGRRAP
ncbi:MAG: hypothetical protein JWR85_2333 [Marmoricola sp.]|nr:hypothetical protein [Marmoricola sp.]